MPRYRTLHSFVGPEFSLNEGEIIECDEAQALPLLERGIIEPERAVESRRLVATDPGGPTRQAVREPRARRGS